MRAVPQVVDNVVYDMTQFLDEHPGGRRLPVKHAGKDATEVWDSIHGDKKEQILKDHAQLRIGVVKPQARAGPEALLPARLPTAQPAPRCRRPSSEPDR